MTPAEAVRFLVFAAGVVAVIGCLGEMWYGPRRGMTWAQFLRYTSWVIFLVTIMFAQYDHRYLPITGYTVSFAIGALVGSLGVAPRLKTPMRKPTEETDNAAGTGSESLGRRDT